MADGFVLEIPEMVGIALAAQRSAQKQTKAWPAGTIIASADSHMLETDCWFDRFPEHLKDEAPRMEFRDGGYHLSVKGRQMTPVEAAQGLCNAMECNPGLTNIDARLADLDIEGAKGADLPAAPVRPLHVRHDDEPGRDLRRL